MPTGELSLIFMLLGPYGVVPVALQLGALGCVARAHGAVVVATATSKSVLISVLISVLVSVLVSVQYCEHSNSGPVCVKPPGKGVP